MSAQEIIDEIVKLDASDLRLVKQKLAEMDTAPTGVPRTGWGVALLEVAGTADDLPADISANHDHYLYGTPKRQ
jgi:hypothetical protein